MATPRQKVAYGLSDALLNVFPAPIVAKRAPTTADTGYQIGQEWVYVTGNAVYFLTSIVSNSANWENVTGGALVLTSLTVNPGPTNLSTVGNGAVSIGNAANTGAITLTSGTGNISLIGSGNTISVGADAAANTVNVGAANTTATTTIAGGSGGILLQGTASAPITLGVAAQTGKITIGDSTAALTIDLLNGVNTGAQVLNIGSATPAANVTVNVLTSVASAGTQTFNVLAGGATRAGTINLGTGAAAHQITMGSATGGMTSIISPILALPGPVYVYTGAGAPSNGLALHVGDLYINTTAASATTRMYIATAASTWTNITCAA